METAHWIAPADEGRRLDFANWLAAAGFTKDALLEYEYGLFFLEELGEGADRVTTGGFDQTAASMPEERGRGASHLQEVGRWLQAQGKYAQAIDCFERVRLLYCQMNLGSDPPGQYLIMSHRVHHARALDLLSQKRFDEADKELALCREFLPADVNLCVDVVPLLDRLGRRKQADQLFQQVYDTWEKIAKDYPRYAVAHHHLGWLAARCGRKHAEAMRHAELAVKLDLSQMTYRDTLAQLYFQAGDKAKAEDIARTLARQETYRPYHQAQLTRIQAGDPRAPLPYDPVLHYRGRTLLLQYESTAEGSIIMGTGFWQSPSEGPSLWD
jgi:tetratricopeptide (TPR) repeat protein